MAIDLLRHLRSTLTLGAVLCATAALNAAAFAQPEEPDDEPEMPKFEEPIKPKADPNNASDTNAAKVYIIELRGEFGRDCSPTPLARAIDEARKMQADYIVVRIDCDYKLRGQATQDFNAAGGAADAYDTEKAAEMATMLTDRIRDDPKWEKKPKLVMWIRKALGPACFFPWVSHDIYYTPDALHGGIGYLDRLFGGTGDYVVREKQRSLRMARAKGLAEKGGYDARIITAMSRNDYVLSVNYVGGKPEYHEDLSGEEILTDGGNEENGRMDKMEDVVRYRGNDVLTLNAEKALKLGISKGTVGTIDDLIFDLGIARNYKVLDGKANKIFSEWSREVHKAEKDLGDKWREFNMTPIEGDTPDKRNQGRSKRIAILNQMKLLVKKYGEALNPRAVRAPTNEADLNSMIEQLQQQIRLDKPRPRGR